MSEHSPEPWMWDEVPLPGIAPTANDPTPTAWPLNDADGHCVLRHQAPWRITAANRSLIAAAPDLLAAAEEAVAGLTCKDGVPSGNCAALAGLRAAIAQARGEEAP